MLFNSNAFIFGFFPVVMIGYLVIVSIPARAPESGQGDQRPWLHTAASSWLALASLVFYGWWSMAAMPLLLGSICGNYLAGQRLIPSATTRDAQRSRLLAAMIAVNLGVLGFFKYADFFIANTDAVISSVGGGPPIQLLNVVLPVGISFYTFTQIAFLVDCRDGKVQERSFIHYLLFVTYFPHLIAGPVLHHGQMMPQFANPAVYRVDYGRIAVGLGIFVIGLSKKMLLADPFGSYADLVFDAARQGQTPSLITAWFGVVAYAFQIYFDFSGYSDMAIGLSLCFGIALPVNFNSPYKATSIIEFWRRWHITLSSFLRDYLYIPLGGNRRGPRWRHANLLLTMALGGLWHGASWNFVLWGVAHGCLLTVNHVWRGWAAVHAPANSWQNRRAMTVASWLATFGCVCLTWVLFRADTLATAVTMYKGLFGANFVTDVSHLYVAPFLALGLFIVLALPNVQQHQAYRTLHRDPAGGQSAMTFSLAGTVAVAVLLLTSVLRLDQNSPFLYFRF
jgi:alginate O-acetyltransferase complex protein AlgI